MAKPDLQNVTVTAAGQLYRDSGQESQSLAFNNLLTAEGPTDAVASGIPTGGIYVDSTSSGIAVLL